MFATLLGGLPRPVIDGQPLPDPSQIEDPVAGAEIAAEIVRESVALQEASGLEPVIDGFEPAAATEALARYRAVEAVANGAVKQQVVGPWSAAAAAGADVADQADAGDLARAIRDLAEAGCPLVEVHEPAAAGLANPAAITAFLDVHRALFAEVGPVDVHLSLALTGGNGDSFGARLFELPYASFAFDLRRGPENWRLITDAPRDRGIVVGAMSVEEGSDDGPELLVWAAHYAGSTGGRGLDRVGLATAGSLGGLAWDVARRKVERLGEAARVAAHETFAEIAPHLDPRAVGTKSAALGRYVAPLKKRAGRSGR